MVKVAMVVLMPTLVMVIMMEVVINRVVLAN